MPTTARWGYYRRVYEVMGKRGIALLVIVVLCLAPVIAITGPAVAQELIWEQLGENGLGEYGTRAFSMVVFDGSPYVGTLNQGGGGHVLRYDGGTSWTQVNLDGFGVTPSVNNKSVECLEVSDGKLYAGTWNEANGCQVWRYNCGTDWSQVNVDGFGNTSNRMVTSMVDLNGRLCAGTDNKTEGCQVWGAVGAPADEDAVTTPLSVETEPESGEAGTSAWTWLLYGLLLLVGVTLLLALAYYLVRRSRTGK